MARRETADRAWALAAELAALMDEAERAEIDLGARLPEAADPEFAAHWAVTVTFLRIVTATWPRWLEEQGLTNPAARAGALLDAQAAAWERAPPAEPVWLVGTTGGIPAVARLAACAGAAGGGGGGAAGARPRPAGGGLGGAGAAASAGGAAAAAGAAGRDPGGCAAVPGGAAAARGRRRSRPGGSGCCAGRCCRGARWRTGGRRRRLMRRA